MNYMNPSANYLIYVFYALIYRFCNTLCQLLLLPQSPLKWYFLIYLRAVGILRSFGFYHANKMVTSNKWMETFSVNTFAEPNWLESPNRTRTAEHLAFVNARCIHSGLKVFKDLHHPATLSRYAWRMCDPRINRRLVSRTNYPCRCDCLGKWRNRRNNAIIFHFYCHSVADNS